MSPSAQDVSRFYDERVGNVSDLNMRLARDRPIHHHTGLVSTDAQPPESDGEALAWLYDREEALVDLVWDSAHLILGRRPRALLDAGCGQGGTLARFSELGGPALKLSGATLSKRQAEVARHVAPSATVHVGDLRSASLAIAERSLELIVAIESTEHLGESGLARFVANAARWLVDDGALLIVAGSWSDRMETTDPLRDAFCAHYASEVAGTSSYISSFSKHGFQFTTQIDLAAATANYWRIRRDVPLLRNSRDGVMEGMIYEGLCRGTVDYRLYGYRRSSSMAPQPCRL